MHIVSTLVIKKKSFTPKEKHKLIFKTGITEVPTISMSCDIDMKGKSYWKRNQSHVYIFHIHII